MLTIDVLKYSNLTAFGRPSASEVLIEEDPGCERMKT
jgi:hypothetical protein